MVYQGIHTKSSFSASLSLRILAISESNWGDFFLKQESPTSCGVVTARNHAQMLVDVWRKRDSVRPVMKLMRQIMPRGISCSMNTVVAMTF